MFEKNEINEIIKSLKETLNGSHLEVTVLGEINNPMPSPPFGPIDADFSENKLEEIEPETLHEKPIRRIINSKNIDTVWEHEKGSVIRLRGEELIVRESIEYIALQSGMDVR